ncbi:MAG: hypothetical protein JWO64_1418 [Hyphomicrobiales bacterium]|jgi:hypothetical protein|nr:hypothetical protein [Hyphomicrobiales bacterium]
MIAVTATFLCSALLGLRLTLFGFVPLMLVASIVAFALQGALAGGLTLVAMQIGYTGGILLRAFMPTRTARPALRRAALR